MEAIYRSLPAKAEVYLSFAAVKEREQTNDFLDGEAVDLLS
jgi:hypothetical protein